MKLLNYDQLDIVGFAGVRERILVMDSRVFGYRRHEDAWEGYGQLTYLAHAYFKPGGSTGRHHHNDVDIVSIVTRGRLHHEGTARYSSGSMTGERIEPMAEILEGQVMVQRSGQSGFMHNEINPDDDIAGMVQIWLAPSESVCEQASQRVIEISHGATTVYTGGDTELVIHRFDKGEVFALPEKGLCYLYQGELSAGENTIRRGTLFRPDTSQCMASTDNTCLLVVGPPSAKTPG